MWYDREHENTTVHPTLDQRRTPPDPSRLTLQRGFCLTASSGFVGLRARRTSDGYSQPIRVPPTNRAQHHPWLQCDWPDNLRGRFFASASTADQLSRRSVRGATGFAASQPPRLWPRDQYVDVILGCPDQLPAGTDSSSGFWRKYPSRSQKAGKELEARQALDYQPRSPLSGKKTHAIG